MILLSYTEGKIEEFQKENLKFQDFECVSRSVGLVKQTNKQAMSTGMNRVQCVDPTVLQNCIILPWQVEMVPECNDLLGGEQ